MPTNINVNETFDRLFLTLDDLSSDSDLLLTEDPLTGIITVSDSINTLTPVNDAVANGSDVDTSAPVLRVNVVLGDGENTLTATSLTTGINVTDGSGYSIIKTGSGDDNIVGGIGKNKIDGGAGADTLDGGDGPDTVEYTNSDAAVLVDLSGSNQTASGGHADNDVISNFENVSGSAFNDTLIGDDTKNIIRGREGADEIFGNGGDDRIFGDDGRDTIDGGAGNDFIEGGSGADIIDGGAGIDTVQFNNSTARVKVYLDRGTGYLGDAARDTYVNVENVEGSAFNDYLSGDINDNTLIGNDGADEILGRAGNDNLKGGAGNDTLVGGAGADALSGGADSDTFVFIRNRDSLLSGQDRISDFDADNDQIQGRYAVGSSDIISATIDNIGVTAFEAALSEAAFAAESAAVVTLGSSSTTFIVLNDSTAGFQADNDAVIDITGYTGDISNLTIIS